MTNSPQSSGLGSLLAFGFRRLLACLCTDEAAGTSDGLSLMPPLSQAFLLHLLLAVVLRNDSESEPAVQSTLSPSHRVTSGPIRFREQIVRCRQSGSVLGM